MTRGAVLTVGARYGRLVVLGETWLTPTASQIAVEHRGNRAALCRCDCGNEKTVDFSKLRRQQIKSCGCLRRERAAREFRTHGLREHPHYQRWQQMVLRCTNPDHVRYADYGGRGITVLEDWLRDPVAFLSYLDNVLGPCPPRYSLDRIDNNGNYVPGNLRWADDHTQRVNQRPRRDRRA